MGAEGWQGEARAQGSRTPLSLARHYYPPCQRRHYAAAALDPRPCPVMNDSIHENDSVAAATLSSCAAASYSPISAAAACTNTACQSTHDPDLPDLAPFPNARWRVPTRSTQGTPSLSHHFSPKPRVCRLFPLS